MSNKLFLQIIFYLQLLIFIQAYSIQDIEQKNYVSQTEDPYYWLEKMDSFETLDWLNNKKLETNNYFKDFELKKNIEKKVIENVSNNTYDIPIKNNHNIFFTKKTKQEDKTSLYMMDCAGNETCLINPNDFTKYKHCSITSFSISSNSKYLSFGLSLSGSDSQIWKILDLENNKILSDEIKDVKYIAPTWSEDSNGIYYTAFRRDPVSNKTIQSIYYHKLHDNDSNDFLITNTRKHPFLFFNNLHVTSDKKFMIITARDANDKNHKIYSINLENYIIKKISPDNDFTYKFIGENQQKLFFITNENAENYKIIAIRLDQINTKRTITEVIPEQQFVLSQTAFMKDYIVCNYLENCCSKIKIFDLSGKFITNVAIPDISTVNISNNFSDNTFFYSYTNFSTPTIIYKYDAKTNTSNIHFNQTLSNDDTIITKQIFFTSKDKTQIPMFITHKKDLKINSNTPVLMYGYGGFNISITPYYSSLIKSWIDIGGIYASVNIRGGGEYGNKWHVEGILNKKQNVFDDFIAAGEYLINHGYTRADKLAIIGRSNGGLLVGSCLTQRPDLFSAAIIQVGVLDMLKFHKFTIGWYWKSDYGDPDLSSDFPYIYAYSPYHNIQDNTNYPATLIMASTHDDRVVPLHSYKFTARLQKAQNSNNPILLRITDNSGHASGVSLKQTIAENIDILTFLVKELKINNLILNPNSTEITNLSEKDK